MRKKPFSQTSLNCHHRITPARAGKTVCPPVEGTTAEDHPRSCGKDVCKPLLRSAKRGSPPLVRERPCCRFRRIHCPRIPPARAGKTADRLACCFYRRDHPRSCGKDYMPNRKGWPDLGSPPLVRKRLCERIRNWLNFRITPARAGKTCKGAAHFSQKWDHPRSCGKDRRGCKIR